MNTSTVKSYKSALSIVGLTLASSALAGPSFEERDISNVGWNLSFQERTYDAEFDSTTFIYSLGVSSGEKALSHWVLGYAGEGNLPAFDFASCVDSSFGLDPTTGTYGLKCDDGQTENSVEQYKIIIKGNVCGTDVDYAVKGGTYYAIGTTTGPGDLCGGPVDSTYSISGVAFVDANGDGMQGIYEPVLNNVTVVLIDVDGNEVVTLTDSDGYYEFTGVYAGSYWVQIPDITDGMSEDFNEQLSLYFKGIVNYNEIALNLSSDSFDNDFGFQLQAQAVLADFDLADSNANGLVFEGTGKTIGFWKHQNAVAIKGKGRAQVDAVTLGAYLTDVEDGWILGKGTFEFGIDAYQEAFDIMKNTSSDSVDLLRKQLLATELNHVAGQGLMGDARQLQDVLIDFAEYVATFSSEFSAAEILDMKDICDLINNTGE
ncbi:hypothetical protein GCM10009104_31260 [Marinobacterium maritimum]|uniref:SD-repeat containing protein B domain-containing protein n=1 Tax=Marinobacterium maritimum TaxID=500162 RepID=A0ABN1I9V7_9GAMM